jgi:hypothetical protein
MFRVYGLQELALRVCDSRLGVNAREEGVRHLISEQYRGHRADPGGQVYHVPFRQHHCGDGETVRSYLTPCTLHPAPCTLHPAL